MKPFALLLLLLVVSVGPARAEPGAVFRSVPSEDVSLPFWCDWGYDWEERCYRDFSNRLSVGGEDDKVWRAALRFPLAAIPPGAAVLSATLSVSFDGVCLGPRKTERPCPARTYTIDVHPILSSDWFHEREVEVGQLVARRSLWARTPQRLSWDVTDQVVEWVEYGAPNDGLLLKLADGEEDFSVSGPRFPSAEFPDAALRPELEVRYLPP
jgi:TGF-beta propeptide